MLRRDFSARGWLVAGAALLFILLGILLPRIPPPAPGPGNARNPEALVLTELEQHPEADPESGHASPRERRKQDAETARQREIDSLFDDLRVLSIAIEIPPDGEQALRRWHWRQGGSSRPEARGIVREGERVYRDVAIQLKGSAGSFRPIDDEPALTLQFDKHDSRQRFHGLKKLSLNNSLQDPSLLSEKISRELFLAAGVPTPRAAHALVKLNGRNLGVYVLVEAYNRQFLKQHFADTSGNLFDSGFVQDVTQSLSVNCGDDPDDRSCLDRLTEAASEPDEDLRLKKLEDVLDLERFLAFVALESMLCHWDGYTMNRNNYRVFHDAGSDRAVFLPHGLDQVFGTGRGSTSQPIIPRARSLVAAAVLETPRGRERYLETFKRLHQKIFDVTRILLRADEISAPIHAVLEEEQPGQLQGFLYRVESLKESIREREQSIESQLSSSVDPPSPAESGLVPVTGWQSKTAAGDPTLTEEEVEGRTCLVIRAGTHSITASWRTTIELFPGRYRFEGRARCRDVGGNGARFLTGACLRVDESTPDRRLTGTRGWTSISQRFRVGRGGGPSEVELRCELRCETGEACFDKQSLRIVRE